MHSMVTLVNNTLAYSKVAENRPSKVLIMKKGVKSYPEYVKRMV